MGMCELCIYTRVNWLCSRPGFLSPRLSSARLWSKPKIRVNTLNSSMQSDGWLSTSGGGALVRKVIGMQPIKDVYRRFFHNGSIVCIILLLSLLLDLFPAYFVKWNMMWVTYNITLQIKSTDRSLCLQEVGMWSIGHFKRVDPCSSVPVCFCLVASFSLFRLTTSAGRDMHWWVKISLVMLGRQCTTKQN